jgi:hypothetical protein
MKGRARRFYTECTLLDDITGKEHESFKCLQAHFRNLAMLAHQNPDLPLYGDIDSSKRRGHGAMIFHVKFDMLSDQLFNLIWDRSKAPPPEAVLLIMFLSRALTN